MIIRSTCALLRRRSHASLVDGDQVEDRVDVDPRAGLQVRGLAVRRIEWDRHDALVLSQPSPRCFVAAGAKSAVVS